MLNFLKSLLSITIKDNYSLINTNINNLQLTHNYYEYKNVNKNINDNDFINMLDIFIEDVKEYYYKEKFITFVIIFFEYNPKLKSYKTISKPFKFDYFHDHYYNGDSLYDCINWNKNKSKLSIKNNIIIRIIKNP